MARDSNMFLFDLKDNDLYQLFKPPLKTSEFDTLILHIRTQLHNIYFLCLRLIAHLVMTIKHSRLKFLQDFQVPTFSDHKIQIFISPLSLDFFLIFP